MNDIFYFGDEMLYLQFMEEMMMAEEIPDFPVIYDSNGDIIEWLP